MKPSERNLSQHHLIMSQDPTDSWNSMQSNRAELQRSVGSPSYPREQQVRTRTQSSLGRFADSSSVREDKPFRLIAKATRQDIKGRSEDLVRRMVKTSPQEAQVRRDRLVRRTPRARPPGFGIRTGNPL